jgi:hydrogenase maturation protease
VNRILIAGVGNSWLQDDGFGGEVVKRLNAGAVPEGCTVIDFGVGGLDLAYEVMHGWDALILLDVSRQGGDPGTLYVMEPDQATIDGGIDEGTMINPHGMDPHTVLRFVKSLGAWPGKVVVIACEPLEVEEMGLGLSEPVSAAVDAAVELTLETVADIRATPEPALPSRPPQVPAN